jgi:hypothetical protein
MCDTAVVVVVAAAAAAAKAIPLVLDPVDGLVGTS